MAGMRRCGAHRPDSILKYRNPFPVNIYRMLMDFMKTFVYNRKSNIV